MDAIQSTFTVSTYCLLLLACGMGVLGVASLRLGGRLAYPGLGSCIFFLCFAAQAAFTVLTVMSNNNAWFIFGGVLGAMTVGGTLDLDRSSSPSTC